MHIFTKDEGRQGLLFKDLGVYFIPMTGAMQVDQALSGGGPATAMPRRLSASEGPSASAARADFPFALRPQPHGAGIDEPIDARRGSRCFRQDGFALDLDLGVWDRQGPRPGPASSPGSAGRASRAHAAPIAAPAALNSAMSVT